MSDCSTSSPHPMSHFSSVSITFFLSSSVEKDFICLHICGWNYCSSSSLRDAAVSQRSPSHAGRERLNSAAPGFFFPGTILDDLVSMSPFVVTKAAIKLRDGGIEGWIKKNPS